jgi:hypothetical protein
VPDGATGLFAFLDSALNGLLAFTNGAFDRLFAFTKHPFAFAGNAFALAQANAFAFGDHLTFASDFTLTLAAGRYLQQGRHCETDV